MKKIFATAALAAVTMGMTFTASADGHSGYNPANYEVAVRAGLCPETKADMARWAYGKKQYSAFAVPTSKRSSCGEPGEPVTAGISTADTRQEAHRAALEVCNANRGSFGRCIVIATVRLKK